MSDVPPIFGDLLKASTQFTGRLGGKLTREQNIMAIFHIVRFKVDSSARIKQHADGSYTITIPAPQQKSLPNKGTHT